MIWTMSKKLLYVYFLWQNVKFIKMKHIKEYVSIVAFFVFLEVGYPVIIEQLYEL